MTTSTPLNDLAEIRSIMERSTKFLSLSAASAVLAGALNLLMVHGRKFVNQRPGWFYSLKNCLLRELTLTIEATAQTPTQPRMNLIGK